MFLFLARVINLTETQHSQIAKYPSGISTPTSNENQQQRGN
jgi:hypothetical protein